MTDLVQQVEKRKEAEVVEQPESEDTDLLDGLASSLDQDQEDLSLGASVRSLFSWKNYSVYLTTSWFITSFTYLGYFLNLYLRELGWEYVIIGLAFSISNFISTACRLVGGYVGDVVNRKHLAVIATLVVAIYNIVMGIATAFTLVFMVILFVSLLEIFKGGSTAYIMDNIPKEHSGLGISLFSSTGRIVAVFVLAILAILVPMFGFGPSMRTMYFVGGVVLVVAALARAALLEGAKPEGAASTGRRHLRSFFEENKRTAVLLIGAAPGLLAVVVVDALSDSMFRFGANIYINEIVGISFEGIIIMTLSTVLISIPLLLMMGRMSDRRGVASAALVIYGFMPVCAAILILAPVIPYWMPASVVSAFESAIPGLGAIFSTPFVAVILKQVNDSLWYLILLTIVQKNLPGKDTSKILGTFWFLVFVSAAIAPYLGGLLFQYFDPQYLFLTVLVLNLIIMVTISKRGLVKESAMRELSGTASEEE
jgi:MFS family permease